MKGTPSLLLQLEKNQKILPSTRDEALFCCGVSKEIPHSHFSLERILTPLRQLKKFPDIAVSNERNTEGPATTQEEPRFCLLILRGGSISLLRRERYPSVPVAPQGEAVSNGNSRGTPGVVPQFQKTLMSQFTPDNPDSPALTRL